MAEIENTFEGGSDETTITEANSGGSSGDAFDTAHINIDGGASELVFDNARAATGSFSMRAKVGTIGNQGANVGWDDSTYGDLTTHYGRFNLYIDTLQGSARTVLARFESLVLLEMTSAGKFRIRDNDGFTADSSNTINQDQWVRFEYKLVHSVSAGEFTVRYFATKDATSHTEEVSTGTTRDTGASGAYTKFGAMLGDANQELWMDDLVAGATDWPGPVAGATVEVSPVDVAVSLPQVAASQVQTVEPAATVVQLSLIDGFTVVDVSIVDDPLVIAGEVPLIPATVNTEVVVSPVTVGTAVPVRVTSPPTVEAVPVSVAVSMIDGRLWYAEETITARETGYFVRDASEPMLVLVYGLDRSLPTAWSSGEGWEIVSSRFVFNDTAEGREKLDAVTASVWTNHKGSAQGVLTDAMNQALQNAGFRRPGGADLTASTTVVL